MEKVKLCDSNYNAMHYVQPYVYNHTLVLRIGATNHWKWASCTIKNASIVSFRLQPRYIGHYHDQSISDINLIAIQSKRGKMCKLISQYHITNCSSISSDRLFVINDEQSP